MAHPGAQKLSFTDLTVERGYDMPTRPARSGRRGPVPDPLRRTPSGFRVTDRQRFELQAAALFLGESSLQSAIECAVQEFLDRLKQDPEFRRTLRAAEAARRRRAGVSVLERVGKPRGAPA